MNYKYNPIPKDLEDVVFLEVVKPLHWHNNMQHLVNCDIIPVGAITWVSLKAWHYDMIDNIPVLINNESMQYAITPENNRYYCNFDPSCFKILHTSKQRIRK